MKLNPLKVQMLSFLDVSIILEQHKYGFTSRKISDTSLLNTPFLCDPDMINDKTFFKGLVDNLLPLLEKNIQDSPWFSIYLTNFEKTNNQSTSMYVLSLEIVQSILETCITRIRAVDDEDSSGVVESLTILMNISAKEPTNQSIDYYFVSNLMNRINTKTKNLYICPHQLCTMFGPQITLEIALCSFFFPQGNGI